MGVLSTSERLQPTLPEIVEQTTPSVGVSLQPTLGDLLELPTVRASEPTLLRRPEQRDAPMCYQCGNIMQQSGSCFVCPSCGSTSGCS